MAFPLSATVDGSGGPIVAWRGLRASGGSSDFDLVVEQWSAGAWTRLGGALNVQPAWGVYDAQVRAAGGTITVAWGETFFRQPRMNYVKQWSGGGWQQLGGRVGNAVALALDAGGTPTWAGSRRGQELGRQQLGTLGVSANVPHGRNVRRSTSAATSRRSRGSAASRAAPRRSPTACTSTGCRTAALRRRRPSASAASAARLRHRRRLRRRHRSGTAGASGSAARAPGAAAGANLVPNPGFESAGVPSERSGGSLGRSTARARSGAYGLAQAATSTQGRLGSRRGRLLAGADARARDLPRGDLGGASKAATVMLSVDLLDRDRGYLRSVEGSSTKLTANVWTRLSVSFPAKSSQAYAAIAPSFSGATRAPSSPGTT